MTAMNGCGFGQFFNPAWLQRFATARCFLVVYGLLGTIQSMSYIYFVATLTTLEKRFKIPSKTTGFMISGNEISQVLLSLLLSYYGGQRNRPLWIAWGVAFSGASCFILAVPHFLYGPGTTALSLTKEHMSSKFFNNTPVFTSKDDAMLCTSDARASSLCHNKDNIGEFSSVPPLLVFFSQFVLGIGTTLYFALGQTYIDDNTKKKNTPILLGLTLSLRTIGPAFGFVVGYFCLKQYIDPTLTPIIDNKDPRWLGAWWLGWLILGSTMILFSLLISLFPKKLPPKKSQVDVAKNGDCPVIMEIVEEKKPPSNNSNNNQVEKSQINEEKSKAPTLKEFPSALARLLKNKLLMVNILSGVFYILGGSGYITYITKYLEIQFQTSAADASFIIGPTTILSMTLGFLGSGIFISKFRPRPTVLLSWNVLVGLSFVIGEISFIFISCTSNSLMGYGNNSKSIQILNECNTACNCQGIKYSPVCLESEDVTFYSACHAGCKSRQTLDSSKMVYSNCSCIYPQIVELKFRAEDIEAERHKYIHYSDPHVTLESGPCKNNCYRSFVIFIGITCIMHFLGSSGKIGNILVNYRCVAEVDKSFAQGLSLLLISLLALIPGPILYGYIIDATCIIWDETCGVRGNCWLYNRDNFRFNLNVTAAAMTSIGAILDGVVCYLGRNLDLYSDNDSNSASCEHSNKVATNELTNKTESSTAS